MSNQLTDIESIVSDWKAGYKGAEQKLYHFAYSHLYTLANRSENGVQPSMNKAVGYLGIVSTIQRLWFTMLTSSSLLLTLNQ